ncbi:MAG: M23 family metallopeptidase [Acidobacteriota bacterium]
MRTLLVALVLSGLVTACSGPSSPSPIAGSLPEPTTSPPPPGPPPPAPPPPAPAGTFSLDLPIAPADATNNAYGLWPFGVHGGDHALDGHPGWDVEYRPGANVLAAAEGTVMNAAPEPSGNGRFTVRIGHAVNGRNAYATDYVNVAALAPGIVAGAAVTRGQVIGPAGVQTQMIGTTLVTWAMIHFQMNDFSRNEGLTNTNAVSPELFLSGTARPLFDVIWRTAAYRAEWCEPFVANPRGQTFPLSRTWTLQSGSGAALFEVQCPTPSAQEYTYRFGGVDGSTLESGTLAADSSRKPLATVDLRSASGSTRLGVWDIVGDTMQLQVAGTGAARPQTLAGASTYITR